MAEWNAETPEDTDAANTIHIQMQEDKIMLRERGEAPDGDIHAHYEWDSANAGLHQKSLVGFCRVHEDEAALDAFTPKKKGTLHAVLSPRRLYVINDAGVPALIFPPSHSGLAGLLDDDHIQYQTTTMAREMTGNLTVQGLTVTVIGSEDDDALPESHESEDWVTAHGAQTLGSRHIADGAIALRHLVYPTPESGTGYIEVTEPNRSWPWVYKATSSHGGEIFWYMRSSLISNSVQHVGFYHDTHGWIDDTVYMGKY